MRIYTANSLMNKQCTQIIKPKPHTIITQCPKRPTPTLTTNTHTYNRQPSHKKHKHTHPQKDLNIPHPSHTRFSTWNIQGYAGITDLLIICIRENIDYMVCQEPAPRFSQNESPWLHASKQQAHRAGYTLFAYKYTIILMNDSTITPKLHNLPIQDQDGRIQMHLLTQPPHAYLIIGAYGHQRAHIDKQTKTTSTTIRQSLITKTNQHIKQYKQEHPQLQIIIIGDLQHTMNNPLHRSTTILTPPPHNLLDFAINSNQLKSVIPHRHPDQKYHTRLGNHGAAGIDHIMAPHELANAPLPSGINHSVRNADFPLQLTINTPTQDTDTKYLYKAVASIPLTLRTNPQDPNDTQLIPDGKLMTDEEHDHAINTIATLKRAHSQPEPQQSLQHANDALDQLDQNTLKATTRLQKDHKSQPWSCIPRTAKNRLLLDQAYTNLRQGIEQIFTICELTQNSSRDPVNTERQRIITQHTINITKPPPTPPNRPSQLTIQHINNTRARIKAIIKYSCQHQHNPSKEHTKLTHNAHRTTHKIAPTLIHLAELMDKTSSQKKAKRKQQKISTHPHTHQPRSQHKNPTTTTQHTIQDRIVTNAILTLKPSQKKTELTIQSITKHTIHNFLTTLTPNPTPKQWDLMLKDKQYITTLTNTSKQLKQLTQTILRRQGKERTTQIQHDILIGLLGNACRSIHPKNHAAPEANTTWETNTNPNQDPITHHAYTTTEQLYATFMGHSKQMQEPPGVPLHFSQLIHDDAGPSGVVINTKKEFTSQHLKQYLPEAHQLPTHIQLRIIQAHKRIAHIFTPPNPHKHLKWPFWLDLNTTQINVKLNLIKSSQKCPHKARSEGFTLNLLTLKELYNIPSSTDSYPNVQKTFKESQYPNLTHSQTAAQSHYLTPSRHTYQDTLQSTYHKALKPPTHSTP